MKTQAKAISGVTGRLPSVLRLALFVFLVISSVSAFGPTRAEAQDFAFGSIRVEGAERVDPATVLVYAGITQGQTVSAADLNDAYQQVLDSGLFETVEFVPAGNTLVIRVQEYPVISRIAIEGNRVLQDEQAYSLLRSQVRRVYNPSVAEADAAALAEAYATQGRLAATVTPAIIRRDGNRVDLVFTITEGKEVEIERISFVGNKSFSERRLRAVLESKQTGLLRAIIKRDTFSTERVEFDKRVLTDFYQSRGYVDFQVLSVSSEFSRERNAFFLTFNIREGQRYEFAQATVSSDLPEVNIAAFERVIDIRDGQVYSPTAIENTISRMEEIALREGLRFIRIEPKISRNPNALTLNVDFEISRGERIFVERIDIEGNTTTLDRVIRRQFTAVEGDPFNPRQIRQAAERIRALGFFAVANVNPKPGSSDDQVVIDVNVVEQPTGSFSFGVNYSVSSGFGLLANFSEQNFLGRGQSLSFGLSSSLDDLNLSFSFAEPAFLGRDLRFRFGGAYQSTAYDYANYQSKTASLVSGFQFPVSPNGRLELVYDIQWKDVFEVSSNSSPILTREEGFGPLVTSAVGYNYSFDNRRTGLNPDAGIVLRFGQDFAGVGGDTRYIRTTGLAAAETRFFNDDVILRATIEGGNVSFQSDNGRITDRFLMGSSQMRGFKPGGIGPRDLNAPNNDALGGNNFAVIRLESEFPIGLPEEYGLTGGLFFDAGSVWGLDNTLGYDDNVVDDSFHLRSVAGLALIWDTPIGPLRFNFTKALQKEDYDKEQTFDLTIQTRF